MGGSGRLEVMTRKLMHKRSLRIRKGCTRQQEGKHQPTRLKKEGGVIPTNKTKPIVMGSGGKKRPGDPKGGGGGGTQPRGEKDGALSIREASFHPRRYCPFTEANWSRPSASNENIRRGEEKGLSFHRRKERKSRGSSKPCP